MMRKSLARCWLAALLVLFPPVIDEAGASCIYDSDTFHSNCAAELVDAREDSSGGQTTRRYEVKGSCTVSGENSCMQVMGDDLKKWHENFNKQFLFKKAVLTWNEAKGLARVQGYLVGEEELELLGIWKTSGSFIDLTYQCAIDPFVNPGAGCKAPQNTGYVKGGVCAGGLDAVCPAFSGKVPKAQAEALIKKHAGEIPKAAPVFAKRSLQAAASGQAVAPAGAALPKPSLSVVSAQPAIDPTCKDIGRLVAVTVKLRNGAMPLAAGLGTVAVFEPGGARLGSPRVPLPAFNANEVRAVEVAVGSTAAWIAALPGPHSLTVDLAPKMTGNQPAFAKPAISTPVAVVLPSGLCQKSLRSSPPEGGAMAPAGKPAVPVLPRPMAPGRSPAGRR